MALGGLGSKIGHADTAEGAPTYITGVQRIKPPELAAKDVPVEPALDGDGHAEHLPGSDDSNTCTFQLPYSAAALTAMLALRRLTKYWTVYMPDAALYKGKGYLASAVKSEASADAPLMINCVVQPMAKWALS